MVRFQSSILTCVVHLVVAVTAVIASTPRKGWHVHHEGNYYFISNGRLKWPDASDACADQGGHLVEIGSAAEQTFLDEVIAQLPGSDDKRLWIGLNDRSQEGYHIWENSRRPGFYTNWLSGEPNNVRRGELTENCVELWGTTWNDDPCNRAKLYICEL